MNQATQDRLGRELAILYHGERKYKLPAAPIARQLLADAECPLPDMLPKSPAWTMYTWTTETLDFTAYWRAIDRKAKIDWSWPYL